MVYTKIVSALRVNMFNIKVLHITMQLLFIKVLCGYRVLERITLQISDANWLEFYKLVGIL